MRGGGGGGLQFHVIALQDAVPKLFQNIKHLKLVKTLCWRARNGGFWEALFFYLVIALKSNKIKYIKTKTIKKKIIFCYRH